MRNDEFMRNLRHLMAVKNCTQCDIAKACSVSQSTVSHWYLGLSKPRGETMLKLADYLCASPSTMIGAKTTFTVMDEERLLRAFRMLSPVGKEKALERMDELTQLYWYSKDVAKEG